jgi:hypothetical protein
MTVRFELGEIWCTPYRRSRRNWGVGNKEGLNKIIILGITNSKELYNRWVLNTIIFPINLINMAGKGPKWDVCAIDDTVQMDIVAGILCVAGSDSVGWTKMWIKLIKPIQRSEFNYGRCRPKSHSGHFHKPHCWPLQLFKLKRPFLSKFGHMWPGNPPKRLVVKTGQTKCKFLCCYENESNKKQIRWLLTYFDTEGCF